MFDNKFIESEYSCLKKSIPAIIITDMIQWVWYLEGQGCIIKNYNLHKTHHMHVHILYW